MTHSKVWAGTDRCPKNRSNSSYQQSTKMEMEK